MIFGVTRVVNFAHGSLYMLGAYIGWSVLTRLPARPAGFVARRARRRAARSALLGVLLEVALLRRIYRAPRAVPAARDLRRGADRAGRRAAIWGPSDLTLPRPPWLRGFVDIAGSRFPAYDLVLIAIGPLVLAALWLLLTRTRWGTLVRAATQDREMVGGARRRSALAVHQRCSRSARRWPGLAARSRCPTSRPICRWTSASIVDAFVVVVVGGMGSLPGAYLAAC